MLWLHILNYKCGEKNKIKYVLTGYYEGHNRENHNKTSSVKPWTNILKWIFPRLWT